MSSIPPKSARGVPCPGCGKTALFAPANPYRPFCSVRCRTRDLGAWASEEYKVPGKPATDDGPDADEEPQ
ncbi:MAG: DNA gyrase inhibitor YacG [Usitatibacter sp.]